jgi:hypothetical protein
MADEQSENGSSDYDNNDHDDDYTSDDDSDMFDDNALTSFRMFHQQLNLEQVEEEPEVEWEEIVEEPNNNLPSPAFITEKLIQRGVNMEELVKVVLLDHSEYEQTTMDDILYNAERRIFGKIRHIIQSYKPEQDNVRPEETPNNSIVHDNAADSKVTLRPHQRNNEFISN